MELSLPTVLSYGDADLTDYFRKRRLKELSSRNLNFGESDQLLIGRYDGTAIVRGVDLNYFLPGSRTSVGNANGNFD